mgnify:CR=1 FL=1
MYDPSTKYEQAETTSDEIQFDLNCEADNRDRVDPNALFQGIDHIVRMMQKQGFDKISEVDSESNKTKMEPRFWVHGTQKIKNTLSLDFQKLATL